MIDINDLRIGDIVAIIEEKGNRIPCKVVGVDKEVCHNSKTRGFLQGAAHLRPFDMEDDEPSDSKWCGDIYHIPLTPKILENNGWKLIKRNIDDDGFEWHVYEKQDSSPQLQYYPKYKTFSAFFGNEEILSDIDYVHQLQHLLWALGLNAEMEV